MFFSIHMHLKSHVNFLQNSYCHFTLKKFRQRKWQKPVYCSPIRHHTVNFIDLFPVCIWQHIWSLSKNFSNKTNRNRNCNDIYSRSTTSSWQTWVSAGTANVIQRQAQLPVNPQQYPPKPFCLYPYLLLHLMDTLIHNTGVVTQSCGSLLFSFLSDFTEEL